MFLIKDSYNENKDDVHYVAVQVSADSKSEWDPSGSDATSGQDYVTDKELHFIVGPDFDRSIATAYGVDAYPTTYFLDKDLNIISARNVPESPADQGQSRAGGEVRGRLTADIQCPGDCTGLTALFS